MNISALEAPRRQTDSQLTRYRHPWVPAISRSSLLMAKFTDPGAFRRLSRGAPAIFRYIFYDQSRPRVRGMEEGGRCPGRGGGRDREKKITSCGVCSPQNPILPRPNHPTGSIAMPVLNFRGQKEISLFPRCNRRLKSSKIFTAAKSMSGTNERIIRFLGRKISKKLFEKFPVSKSGKIRGVFCHFCCCRNPSSADVRKKN